MGADGVVAAAVPGVKRYPSRLPASPVAAQGDVVRAPDLPHAAAEVGVEHVVGVALDGHGGGVAVDTDSVVARSYGTVTGWMTTGPRVGLSSVAWETPAGVITSMALGTVVGSTKQIGAVPPAAQTPNV